MDDRVAKLKSPEECERFASNAERLGHSDLVVDARKRAVELRAKICEEKAKKRAEKYGASSEAEKECLKAICAYEEVLTWRDGRRTRATCMWQMIGRHGILEIAERAVNQNSEATGYTELVEMGLQELSFEAVICRHPDLFSPEVVDRSQQRMLI